MEHCGFKGFAFFLSTPVNFNQMEGHLHEQALAAHQLVVHPDNRSGVLVNSL